MFLKKKRKEAAKELTIHSAGVITALGKVLEAKLVVFRSSWSTGWICLHKCNGEVERERERREKRKDRKEGFSMTLKPMADLSKARTYSITCSRECNLTRLFTGVNFILFRSTKNQKRKKNKQERKRKIKRKSVCTSLPPPFSPKEEAHSSASVSLILLYSHT